VGTFVRTVRQARPADYRWQTAALGAPRARLSGLSSTQRASVPDAIALHSGYPGKALLPERLVRAALARAARTEAALMRSPAAGLPELQAWFASQVADAAPVGVTAPSARDVLIVAGSQSGLSSIFRALVGPGQPLLIESPTYWGAILAASRGSLCGTRYARLRMAAERFTLRGRSGRPCPGSTAAETGGIGVQRPVGLLGLTGALAQVFYALPTGSPSGEAANKKTV
jgi:hypothetical protein